MTKLEKSIVECLDAQKELLQSINELTIIMKKVFNGEPAHDPAVEEGDLERDLPELSQKDVEELDASGSDRPEYEGVGEPDIDAMAEREEEDRLEREESGLLPDDDEDKDKDN